MTTITTPSSLALVPSLETAWQDVDSSFERFCLTAGIGAIEQMLCEDAQQLAGTPHNRGGGRVGHRWGRTKGKIGFHGGKVAVHRPRVRSYDGHELALAPSTLAAVKLTPPIRHGCPSAGLACSLGSSTAAGSSVRPNQGLKARPHALNRFVLAHKSFIAHF